MTISETTPDQRVVETDCWSCGARLSKTVPRRRRGPGHVLWACDDCEVTWTAPAGG
ncbi:hypothetical protein ACQP2F_24860 [Actinoplanes sp. CA-030573]|uniref:hypothetical protein n=1 Tax=Actinoplanes sp. CA-030573 TaxID=3239898 RepID=UPI003D89E80E